MTLTGKAVVETRALHQADELNVRLRERGAVPLSYPCIAIVPREDTAPLDAALQQAAAGGYDWLILTSSNAVLMLAERLKMGLTAKSLRNNITPSDENLNRQVAKSAKVGFSEQSPRTQRFPKAAAVGEATAQMARECLGINVDLIPHDYHAAAIADLLATQVSGLRVLLPQSEIADSALHERLTAAGAVVTTVTAYRTVIGSGGADVPAMLRNKQVDAVTFTSPSTVDNFLQRLASEGGRRADLMGVGIACLGKTTARAAESHGLQVDVLPETPTINGMIEALEGYFENNFEVFRRGEPTVRPY